MTLEVAPPDSERLTERESQVMALLMHGTATTRGIARVLMISEHTVHYHLSGLMRKLGVCNQAQVVSYAWTHGRVVGDRWTPGR